MTKVHTAGEKAEPTIQVRTLHKSFGPKTVLNGINLEVREAETLSVLGRSGTGKSVLLKLIVGLQAPDSGSMRIHGQEITGLPTDPLNEIRKKIGFSFQQSALYDSLTVEENVAFPLRRHTKMSDIQLKRRVQELLSTVGMQGESQKLPGQISGGMQKRVGLARALALEPDILLFDEPTAGLDPITAAEIGGLILRLQEKRKVASIVVTHDIRGARTVSDRLALLRDGQILIEGSPRATKTELNYFAVSLIGVRIGCCFPLATSETRELDMSRKATKPEDEKPSVTLPGTVEKIIPPIPPIVPEKAQIAIEGAEELYKEIRVENVLQDGDGNAVALKPGAEVEVKIEADKAATIPKDPSEKSSSGK